MMDILDDKDAEFLEESAGAIEEHDRDKAWPRCSSPDDPDRCQAVTSRGQCMLKRVAGSKYCYAHGGSATQKSATKASLKNYRLTQFHIQVAEKSTSSGLKDLSEEIGILRMILQERLNSIESANDLMIYAGTVMQLTSQIGKLVESCHKIDRELNNLIDRSQMITIAEGIVNLIAESIEDEDKRRIVSAKILDLIIPPDNE